MSVWVCTQPVEPCPCACCQLERCRQERDKALRERNEAQEAAEKFRASMYALEERVAELTRERDQWKKLAESRAFDEFDAEIDG